MIRLPGPKLAPAPPEAHPPSEHSPEQHSVSAEHALAFCFRAQPLAAASGTSSVVNVPQADSSRASTRCLAIMISSSSGQGGELAPRVVGVATRGVAGEVAREELPGGGHAGPPELDASGGIERRLAGGERAEA